MLTPATSLDMGGVALARALPALRRLDPHARACWVYDLDALAARARRFRAALTTLDPLCGYALKANALHPVLDTLRAEGFGGEAGSLGELELCEAAGFPAERRILNGNGRTPEEADWAAARGVHSINADHAGELDLLQQRAAAAGRTLRVALRVNPGIATDGHPYVATGHGSAKFGVSSAEALDAWSGRARWPALRVEGVHVHVGSQLQDPRPLEEAARFVLELAAESARRGAPLSWANLGGGFGVDYSGAGLEFPLERYARALTETLRGQPLAWVFEPGRWLVAPIGALLAEVLWVKRRGDRRFVVLAAGLNDLIRPALYGARHRIIPLEPRAGAVEPSSVVGPVCESSDCFADDAPLPPLERGDVVAILDAGAYGASMSSSYNGRGRLAELVASQGTLRRARAAETPRELVARRADDPLQV